MEPNTITPRRVELFEYLSDLQLAEIKKAMKLEKYKPDEPIIEEGDEGQDFYVILNGVVLITIRDKETREPIKVAQLDSGHAFGEVSFIDGTPRSATVRASENTTLARFSYNDMQQIMEYDHGLGLALMRKIAELLCTRVRKSNQFLGCPLKDNMKHTWT